MDEADDDWPGAGDGISAQITGEAISVSTQAPEVRSVGRSEED
jgi:hypothetical protein